MRTIKFRAWYKGDESMIEPVDIQTMIHQTVCTFPLKDLYEDFIFMQFTGLLDKNGKEIYEGDIVKILYTDWASKSNDDKRTLDEYLYDKSETKVVIWDTQGFYVSSKIDGYSESMEPGKHGFIQVIGNIYENPELLPKN